MLGYTTNITFLLALVVVEGGGGVGLDNCWGGGVGEL